MNTSEENDRSPLPGTFGPVEDIERYQEALKEAVKPGTYGAAGEVIAYQFCRKSSEELKRMQLDDELASEIFECLDAALDVVTTKQTIIMGAMQRLKWKLDQN